MPQANTASISPGRRLRELMARGTVALPGATNALTARLIERMGFDGYYLSGAVLANSVIGQPDVGLTTLSEAAEHAARCTAVSSLPAIMDADTGFGGSEECVARTVREYERAGLAGLHLEDQEFPKRCGHLPGKSLVPVEEFTAKIAAAASARRDREFLLIARTDARGVTGYDDAVARAHAYLKAGADAIFPEALENEEEFARFARDVPAPLLANMTEFGKTPYLSVQQFGTLGSAGGSCSPRGDSGSAGASPSHAAAHAVRGYRLVIFPVTLQRVAMKACEQVLAEIKAHGTQKGALERMQTRQELYELLGYQVNARK